APSADAAGASETGKCDHPNANSPKGTKPIADAADAAEPANITSPRATRLRLKPRAAGAAGARIMNKSVELIARRSVGTKKIWVHRFRSHGRTAATEEPTGWTVSQEAVLPDGTTYDCQATN